MIRNLIVILMIAAMPALPAAAVEPFPGIEKLMTPEQVKGAGLHKLSPEELKALNSWLQSYSAGTVQAAKSESRAEVVREVRQQEQQAKQEERIVSQIVGEFTGWSGKTVFRLKNGQVWQQRTSGQLRHKATEPKVEITKNILGYYMMKLVGTSYGVGVKRIN